jgi:hypothetical protein
MVSCHCQIYHHPNTSVTFSQKVLQHTGFRQQIHYQGKQYSFSLIKMRSLIHSLTLLLLLSKCRIEGSKGVDLMIFFTAVTTDSIIVYHQMSKGNMILNVLIFNGCTLSWNVLLFFLVFLRNCFRDPDDIYSVMNITYTRERKK